MVFFYLHNCYYEKIGNSNPIKLEDLPFDIPDNWTWIRLGKLCKLVGTGIDYYPNKKYYYSTGSIKGDIFTPEGEYEFDKRPSRANRIASFGDIIDAKMQGTLKVQIIDERLANSLLSTGFYVLKNYLINIEYLKYFICTNYYQHEKDSRCSGTTQKAITDDELEMIYISLPTINEQQRIVDKIKLFEQLLRDYEKAESKLSILEEEFSDKLKKSILQYAIEGKLVKQDPNDEPASVLLERIKAEKEKLIKEGKIKKDKNESFIYQGDDKNYYEKIDSNFVQCDEITQINLPINWAFCYFENISTYGFTTTNSTPKLNSWLLELEDIVSGSLTIKNKKYVNNDTNLNSKVCFKTGMILYSKLRPYLDKILLADEDGVASSEIVPFYSLIDSNYLITFLRSPYFLNRVINLMYGVKMPRLGTHDMIKTIVPLPPLSEQKRIMSKILSINKIINE